MSRLAWPKLLSKSTYLLLLLVRHCELDIFSHACKSLLVSKDRVNDAEDAKTALRHAIYEVSSESRNELLGKVIGLLVKAGGANKSKESRLGRSKHLE